MIKSHTMLNSTTDELYNLHYVSNLRRRQPIKGNEDIFEPIPVENLKQHILNFINSELADNLEELPILSNLLPTQITITISRHNKEYNVLQLQKDIKK